MTPIFIDTSAFIALLRQKDIDHLRARRALKTFSDKNLISITTDYILDEAYTGLLKREGYQLAIEFDQQLNAGIWQVERINTSRFTQAQIIFRKFNRDKFWSFTDCASYVVMKELKITTAFTFDSHFEQMGFSVLT